MTNNPLLPCPFCGGEAEILDEGEYAKSVICNGSDCRASTGLSHCMDIVIQQWNTRAAADAGVDDAEPKKARPIEDVLQAEHEWRLREGMRADRAELELDKLRAATTAKQDDIAERLAGNIKAWHAHLKNHLSGKDIQAVVIAADVVMQGMDEALAAFEARKGGG